MDQYEIQCAKDDVCVIMDQIQGTEECKTLKTLMNYINHLEENLVKRAEKNTPKVVVRNEKYSQACPECGLAVNWHYCPNCGQRLSYGSVE